MITVLTRGMWATDFSDIPLGDGLQSHGWTRGGADTGGGGGTNYANASYVATAIMGHSVSDRGIVVDQTNVNEYRAARWTTLGLLGDFSFLALVQLIDEPDTVGGGGFGWVLGDGNNADGYDWVFDDDNVGANVGVGVGDSVHISEFSNGFYDNEGAQQKIRADSSAIRLWLRGYKSGTTYGIKCWDYGLAEPASFQTRTDATYQSTRYFAIQTVQDKRFRVDWLSVAVGSGKTAPFPSG